MVSSLCHFLVILKYVLQLDSPVAYLMARCNKLQGRERLVSVLMDEVYSNPAVQYVNGKFFGAENGQVTKRMLCVMIKSIVGKYCDIIAMVPVVNINADILYSVWKNIVTQISKTGFDID